MAANTNPIHPGVIVNTPMTWANADGITKKAIITGGSNGGTRVDSLHACYDDTATINFNVYLSVGGTDYFQQRVTIYAGAGYTTVWQELLASLNDGYAMAIAAGAILKGEPATAVPAGKTLTVTPYGGDY